MSIKRNNAGTLDPTKGNKEPAQTNLIATRKKEAYEILYDEYLGEMIPYVVHEGKKRYPVNAIGRLFGYDEKHETQLYERNKEILKDNAYPLKIGGKERATLIWCVDSIGLLILTGRADMKRLPEKRINTVIKIVQMMAESTDMRLKGDLIPRSEVENMIDVGSIKDDPKSIQGDNSLRRALFIKKVNEAHPSSPNTVNRLKDLSHNDQALLFGPGVPFEAGKHKKYSKDVAKKDSAQKMVSFAAIACGKIEMNDINRFEREVFRGLPEQYIPDHLNDMIESTRQSTLLESGNDSGKQYLLENIDN
jgi:hypothetical protein